MFKFWNVFWSVLAKPFIIGDNYLEVGIIESNKAKMEHAIRSAASTKQLTAEFEALDL